MRIRSSQPLPGKIKDERTPRVTNFGVEWSAAEESVVSQHYRRLSKTELMTMLPGRSWRTIQARASMIGCAGLKLRGPNRFEVRGDIVVIFLEQRDGSVHECVISAHQLDAVLSLGRWHVDFVEGKPYVRTICGDQTVLLHRFIKECPEGFDVDHKDDDGLNNIDDNLRIATRSQNNQNKSPLSENSVSGYRNVGFHKASGLWTVRIKVAGKEIVKYVKSREAAIELAAELRRQYHPFAARG
jgi:hypothetical protein